MPGLDGTGTLFADFTAAVDREYEPTVIQYPTDSFTGYSVLIPTIESAVPKSEPFVIVAESFSAPLAIQFAATNPPNLKAVIICAGFASNPLRGWRRIAVPLVLPVMFKISLPAAAVRLFLVGNDAPASLVSAVQRAVSSVQHGVIRERLRAVLACDVVPELRRIKVPVMYIRGANDRLVGVAAVEEIKKAKPDVVVATVRAPHLVVQTTPIEAAAVIRRFIQQLESVGS